MAVAVAAAVLVAATATGGEPLKVVFVGKYRSGSSSLAAALKRLGYNPCHGRDVIDKSLTSHAKLADALMNGNVSEILRATSDLGCNATLEMHAIFWKEIVEYFSDKDDDIKYIVVLRPFEEWRKSVTNLFSEILPIHRYPLRFLPKLNKASDLFASLAQRESGLDSKAMALDAIRHPNSVVFQENLKQLYDGFVHDAHHFMAERPSQTLLFDLKDGYAPLCQFLNVVDCPIGTKEVFPHLNKSRDIQLELMMERLKEFVLHLVILLLTILPMLYFWRRKKRKEGLTDAKSSK